MKISIRNTFITGFFITTFILVSLLESREIIKNGEFDNGWSGWLEWHHETAQFNRMIDETGLLSGSNSCLYEIIKGGEFDWHIQLPHACPLQPKSKYYIRYSASHEGNSGVYNLTSYFQSPIDPWPIWFQQTVEIVDIGSFGPIVFESDIADDSNEFKFLLGGEDEAYIWVDSVSVIEEGPFWQNTAIDPVTEAVILEFDVIPDSAVKSIFGLSKDSTGTMDDIVCGVSFTPDGRIQALNGSDYTAETVAEYINDYRNHIVMNVNIRNNVYSVTVKPYRQDEQVIATNYPLKKFTESLGNMVVDVDIDPANGGRPYTCVRVLNMKTTATTAVKRKEQEIAPVTIHMRQNYPNPFNPLTSIEFYLPKTGDLSLQVFDVTGRKVRELMNGTYGSGYHRINWNAKDDRGEIVPNGIYYVRLKSGDQKVLKKMTFIR